MPSDVRIKKTELMQVLVANRAAHRATFLKAQAAYRSRVIEELDRRLKDARDGRQIDLAFRMPVPEDHTAEYDREIRMLEMEIGPDIRLGSHEFDWYVMDSWAWKEKFVTTNSSYGVS